MKTLISGQAGIAAFIQGNETTIVSIDNLRTEKLLPLNALNYILADATDVSLFKDISKTRAIKLLDMHWRFDRSLHLIIILLTIAESESVSLSAAECLEEFFIDKEILDKVANVMYSSPIPSIENIEKALRASLDKRTLTSFLKELKEDQPVIAKYSRAWDALPLDYFDSTDGKSMFRDELIKKGAFRSFVKATHDVKRFGAEQIRLLIELSAMPNYRQVLAKWVSGLKPKHVDISKIVSEEKYSHITKKSAFKAYKCGSQIKGIRENIEKQKIGIITMLKKEDTEKARKYVEQLINTQKQCGEPEHIAKSLCDLAQEAKEIHNYSFQLELTQRAVEIAPFDGWAFGQLADAYYCLHKFSEALKNFNIAISYGHEAFGLSGRARILYEQGRLEEAFDAFDNLKDRFPNEIPIWAARAETLRGMWWLELALAAYEEAISKFTSDRVLHCGRAATLADMGRFDEAITSYDNCIKALGEDPIAINGLATVFRKIGNYKKALQLYDKGLRQFRNNTALKYGHAKVMQEMGKFNQAFKEFDNITLTYPYETRAWIGKAEVLKELKFFPEANKLYDQALDKFPFNNWIRNGRASVYKKQGAYEKALQTYEYNLSIAPYDMVAKCGRADLLKQLGEFEEALRAYDDVIKLNPNRKSLQYAKASICITLGRYTEAEKLLPCDTPPKTINDWIAYHVKAVLLMKKNEIETAISLLNDGFKKCPFIKTKAYFRNSLAIAKLKNKDFKGAINSLPSNTNPITNILNVHGWGEIAKKEKRKISKIQIAQIAHENLKADCPPYLIPLMIELELRYFGDKQKTAQTEEWIFEQECNSTALSLVA